MEKVFQDPVHGFITVDEPLLLALIDTPEFQRLRRLRQLGAAGGTYHGAEHSRFGHALGAMHVMKRVLARFRDLGIPVPDEDRKAALAAALLHDIGHGPLSHLWEKVGGGRRHEEWTAAILAGDTGIRRALEREDPAFPERVLAILQGRHPAAHLSLLVSSQLDVDRMDYLLRDGLMTGASYGRFDLERLVHTMTVLGGRVVVLRKGLANVEEYLLARYFMYWRVYFHRTIRAQELLFQRLMARAADLIRRGGRGAVPCPPALAAVLGGAEGGRETALEDHLALDDVDVYFAVKGWASSEDGILRDLSARFLHRRLPKPVFADPPAEPPPDRREALEALLRRRGWDPRYYLAYDRTGEVAYDYYVPGEGGGDAGASPILILDKDGRVEEVSRLSPLLGALAGRAREGYNIYVPEDCRDEARALFAAATTATVPPSGASPR